jgi:hypothetical protein
VLEHKTAGSTPTLLEPLEAFKLRPMRLSKFLWATSFGGR